MTSTGIAWSPPEKTKRESNLAAFLAVNAVASYDDLVEKADADPKWFWETLLERLSFYRPFDEVMDASAGVPFTRWCKGGETNVVLNVLDRHRDTPIWQKEALVWVAEDGDEKSWSYRQVSDEVARLANALRELGIGRGDVVGLFLPNIPEAMFGFLACAKIGAISLPLFSGFGVEALRDRLATAGATAILTADGAWRRGSFVQMKTVLDAALSSPELSVATVVVVSANGDDGTWRGGRDHDYKGLVAGQSDRCETRHLPSDAPLMLMYTSGTTGKPKATVHTHVGFCAKMLLDMVLVMDLKESDRVLWMSDMGWLVGPMMAVAVPLAGATWVLAEGVPDYPTMDRLWSLADEQSVSFLGLAPTTARAFMRSGEAGSPSQSLSSLRICASTGEAWTPDAWHWVFDKVCRRRVPLLNYSGGTEVGGGILGCSVLHPIKPCAFSRAIPGMAARIVSDDGSPVPLGEVGELVLEQASIGMSRSLWGDDARYLESYWSAIPGKWRHGDWASVDEDGYWYIHGRSDDTLKIAGKRTGPSEVESLLASTGHIVESAVIGLPDAVKGQSVCCVVIAKGGVVVDDAVKHELASSVVRGLGSAFRPAMIIAAEDLPRTRNMKVMRRVVRAAALGEGAGDLSSLVNPESVDRLRVLFEEARPTATA